MHRVFTVVIHVMYILCMQSMYVVLHVYIIYSNSPAFCSLGELLKLCLICNLYQHFLFWVGLIYWILRDVFTVYYLSIIFCCHFCLKYDIRGVEWKRNPFNWTSSNYFIIFLFFQSLKNENHTFFFSLKPTKS